MALPAIELPKIELPFDIPVLIHPAVDHFAIVVPIVILLLEVYNLFVKRKSIGVFSFLLILLMIVIFSAAYLTGTVDGKETYDFLTPEGQEALKTHKLLGTYLLIASGVVLFFKLLAMTGKKVLKILFFIVLIVFVGVTLKQGKEGGELVYKYGANIEKVKELDDALFDANDALEDLQDKLKSTTIETAPIKESITEKNHPASIENQTIPEPIKVIKPTKTELQEDLDTKTNIENANSLEEEAKNNIPFPGEHISETVAEPVKEEFPLDMKQPKIETH